MAENRYEYWQKALALTGGKRAVTRDEMKALGLIDEPQSGFFRKRTMRAGPFVPVAIWYDGDAPVATVNGKVADAGEVWTYCCPHPVPEAWFRAASNGEPWPDEDPAVTASYSAPAAPPADAVEGHNQPPADEAEVLQGQIDAASKNAAEYATIKDDDGASKAQSVRSRLLDLSGQADKKRVTEKEPFLEGGRKVDARWQHLVKGADAAAEALKLSMKKWINWCDWATDEVVRVRQEKNAAAENARLAQVAKGKKAPAPPPPEPEPVPEPMQTQIRGASGRAASIKTVKVVTITDQDALYHSVKTHPNMIEFLQLLAKRAVDAGKENLLKGVTITEEKDLR